MDRRSSGSYYPREDSSRGGYRPSNYSRGPPQDGYSKPPMDNYYGPTSRGRGDGYSRPHSEYSGRDRGHRGYNSNPRGSFDPGYHRGGSMPRGSYPPPHRGGDYHRGGHNPGGYNRGGYNTGGYNRGGYNTHRDHPSSYDSGSRPTRTMRPRRNTRWRDPITKQDISAFFSQYASFIISAKEHIKETNPDSLLPTPSTLQPPLQPPSHPAPTSTPPAPTPPAPAPAPTPPAQ
ncbi:unnamed protein product [Moneuplotes crassus]|uniref:Uncharacterized protein n=1 Tax=Euplotes crassus TaxID=5936 RepID=A0AAD1XV91_EUPCR|nr:unnamed protein product [Moneuplotes crassus]